MLTNAKWLAEVARLHCVNNGFHADVVNVGGTFCRNIINAAMMGWFDLGSSGTQTFNSFRDCAFLSLLSQNVSLQVLSCCWCRAYNLASAAPGFVFFSNSGQLSGTGNFFLTYNRISTHNFIFSFCGNKGCSCYSTAVLRE